MSHTLNDFSCIPDIVNLTSLEPSVFAPCVNGEPCPEITDAGCVNYSGLRLANIDVNPNDRLDTILNKLNVNQASAGIETEDTNDIDFTGSGVLTAKLQASVKVNTEANNLLIKTPIGLRVEFNKVNLLQMMTVIAGDQDLMNAFCNLVKGCATNGTCSIATNINVSMN